MDTFLEFHPCLLLYGDTSVYDGSAYGKITLAKCCSFLTSRKKCVQKDSHTAPRADRGKFVCNIIVRRATSTQIINKWPQAMHLKKALSTLPYFFKQPTTQCNLILSTELLLKTSCCILLTTYLYVGWLPCDKNATPVPQAPVIFKRVTRGNWRINTLFN